MRQAISGTQERVGGADLIRNAHRWPLESRAAIRL